MKLNFFNFKKVGNQILLTNDFGRYAFVTESDFKKIVAKKVDCSSNLGKRLINEKIIYDETDLEYSFTNYHDLRAAKKAVNTATALHIFVVTTVCNMSCVYCQANNGKKGSNLFMTIEMAEKAVDIALQSPAHYLTFEFQGGEPLLNFDVVKHIVEYAEEHKGGHSIEYSMVTNLTLLTDQILTFLVEHQFGLSTSLDGAKEIHNHNRCYLNGAGTFSDVAKKIEQVRLAGLHIGAIETTTHFALMDSEKLVETYLSLGFESIFVRPLTPLGRAAIRWVEIGYTPEEYLEFYKSILDKLIEVNKQGTYIREDFAAILLRRIKGDFVNYMELRSPCGAGIGQLAYYSDGTIFTCDEGRMLYEMGDKAFKLGNVWESKYSDLIKSDVCKAACAASILETIPGCCDCVYQPYCGICPVINYSLEKDILVKQPRGYRCKIHEGILEYLFLKIFEANPETIRVLNSWSN